MRSQEVHLTPTYWICLDLMNLKILMSKLMHQKKTNRIEQDLTRFQTIRHNFRDNANALHNNDDGPIKDNDEENGENLQ